MNWSLIRSMRWKRAGERGCCQDREVPRRQQDLQPAGDDVESEAAVVDRFAVDIESGVWIEFQHQRGNLICGKGIRITT